MIGIVMLLTAPTIADVVRLKPDKAGDLVLRGREHGPIDRIAVPAAAGLDPPGVVELELVERAQRLAHGCLRKRWTAAFHHADGVTRDAATLVETRPATEIALSRTGRCPDGQYAHINPGVALPIAFGALSQLDDVRAGRRRVRFVCADATRSGLCRSEATIRSGLAYATPWAISARGGSTVLWLGIPGQVVTEIRFDPVRPGIVQVDRRIPAPS